jgi:uncharacterized protein DUF3516
MIRSAWDAAIEDYYAEHDTVGTAADARGPQLLQVTPQAAPERIWRVRQTLDDPEGHHDWVIDAVAHLDASDEAGELVLLTTAFHRL